MEKEKKKHNPQKRSLVPVVAHVQRTGDGIKKKKWPVNDGRLWSCGREQQAAAVGVGAGLSPVGGRPPVCLFTSIRYRQGDSCRTEVRRGASLVIDFRRCTSCDQVLLSKRVAAPASVPAVWRGFGRGPRIPSFASAQPPFVSSSLLACYRWVFSTASLPYISKIYDNLLLKGWRVSVCVSVPNVKYWCQFRSKSMSGTTFPLLTSFPNNKAATVFCDRLRIYDLRATRFPIWLSDTHCTNLPKSEPLFDYHLLNNTATWRMAPFQSYWLLCLRPYNGNKKERK